MVTMSELERRLKAINEDIGEIKKAVDLIDAESTAVCFYNRLKKEVV